MFGATCSAPFRRWAIVLFGAGYKNVVALSVLLVVLRAFPNGVFGRSAAKH